MAQAAQSALLPCSMSTKTKVGPMQKRLAANERSGACEPGPAFARSAAKVGAGAPQAKDLQRRSIDLHDNVDPGLVSRSADSQREN